MIEECFEVEQLHKQQNNGKDFDSENLTDFLPNDADSKPKLTRWATFSVVVASFCGCLPYGYALGSVNSAAVPIKSFIGSQYMIRYNTTASQSEIDTIFVFIVASFPVGGICGCFLVPPMVNQFGKLRSMAYLHACTTIAAILMGLSEVMMSYEIIIIGRFVVGCVTSSAGTGISPMYSVEVVPKEWRGTFGGLVSFFISFGVLVSNTLGLSQVLGNPDHWPVLLALIGFPGLLYLICCTFLANSPRTLYLTKGDTFGAEELLKKLRNSDDVGDEMEILAKEKREQESTSLMTVLELFRSGTLRHQVVATLVVSLSQQLSGLNGVVIYMNQLFGLAGVPENVVPFCSIASTALLSFSTLGTVRLLDRLGRKPLLKYGFMGQASSLILLTITAEIKTEATWLPYLSLIFASVFLVSFAVGPGPVTLLLVSEIFPQRSRPAAITLSCVSIFFGFAVTVIVWPYMQSSMGGYAYLPFAFIAVSCAVFVHLCVPETKGKTFVETERAFHSMQIDHKWCKGKTEPVEINANSPMHADTSV
uniref:Solute carrier family 2, facilitated glucose transporter member 5 n=1 Tax=Phallusia mammillata TaxID=59560 RepID=A0A6F9DSR2_9ASCI|nr:solute carrier family 2, facilitated glucose transporter member 5 [Phallusia mammillata]